jgi:hypothetical protein
MSEHETQQHESDEPVDSQSQMIAQWGHEAQLYEERYATTVLSSLGKELKKHISPGGFALYRHNTLAKAGDPSDPLERMMIEQLLWMHQRIGDLHLDAARAAVPELINALNGAVTKLAAEFRKSVLALRQYRHPMPPPQQLTLIKQQNVAAGDQQIAMVDSAAALGYGKKSTDTELINKPELLGHVEPALPFSPPNRWEVEPRETQAAHTGRTSALTRGRLGQPPLEVLNGSTNGSR